MSKATYSAGTLEIDLPRKHHIGPGRFDARANNYMSQLRARKNIPDGLRVLIAKLFEHGVITDCNITFGTKFRLKLSKRSPKGHLLLGDGPLRQFQEAFSHITGKPIEVEWSDDDTPTKGRGRRRGSKVDAAGVVGFFANVLDAVADGFILAAAFKTLFGDDD